jgi:hypothetical protein
MVGLARLAVATVLFLATSTARLSSPIGDQR